jgi:hypothetical protein
MAGYDPKKAELFNKLRKSGLGDEQAWKQAGLTDADEIYYTANDGDYNADGSKNLNKGQLGELIVGGGSKPPVLSAEEKAYRASIDAAGAGFDERLAADSARFDAPAPAPANVTKVDYPVSTRSTSSTKTVETYTSTSTEQVSGGGSTTTTAGAFKENAKTQALQPQIDAKQAELSQSYKDYPTTNRGREAKGLPLLTPDELEANQRRATNISKEKVALEYKQQDAGTPGEPTVTTVPNTTTTESTTTYSRTVTNSGLSNVTSVQSPGAADPANNPPPSAPVSPIVLQTGYTANVTGKEYALATNEKNLAGREANQQQLLDNANSFSRSEQQRLDAEAAAAAARGDPDAAAKRAEAEQYATDRANATDAASRNQTLIDADKQLIAQQQGELAQAKAQAAANPVPPGYVVATAGDDPANNPPPPVDQTETPASFSAEPVDTPLLTPAESIERAQVDAPAPVDAATFNANTNASVLGAIGVPPPVDPATDPNQSAAETARLARGGADAAANAATAENNALASAGAAYKQQAKEQAAIQAQFQSPANGDWRVRLRLAPSAKYLYMDENAKNGILAPLAASNGVVFPYMPTIQTSYNADYDSVELTHSNYRGQFYKSSYVGDVSITGTFTAQDTAEANYLLAVIHFFRSVTKMFYGAKDPLRGAPPPLVYLIGLGQYQFNNQPCVVKTFNYSMPNDCDYIRTKPNNYNTNLGGRGAKPQGSTNPIASVVNRLKNAALPQGAVPNVPAQDLLELQSVTNIADATYVPTKCEIQLTLMPIQTRSQQSQQFNMPDFANGNLLKGGFW